MDYTTNYQLPVWAETDRILLGDFNDSYEKIENALSGLRDDVDANTSGLSANTAAHAHFGNCQLYTLSYVGTGGSSCAFSVPGNPVMAMAADYTIALVDEIVDAGYLDPESVVTPHVYVDAIVKGE